LQRKLPSKKKKKIVLILSPNLPHRDSRKKKVALSKVIILNNIRIEKKKSFPEEITKVALVKSL